MGGEFAVSVAEQQRQLDALKTLDAGLSSAALVSPAAFEVRALDGLEYSPPCGGLPGPCLVTALCQYD